MLLAHLVAGGSTNGGSMSGMHGMAGMGHQLPLDWHTALTAWQSGPFAILAGAALLAIAVAYLRAVHQLSKRGRRWHPSRTVSFLVGLVLIEVALGSSVAGYATSRFSSHVIQHLLLMVAAPPALALGAPMTLLLQTSSRPTKRRLLAALHSRPFALLSHPIPVFALYYLSMYAFFLTGALGYAMNHMWVMDVINLGFLGGATLFWWPMIGLDPIPRWQMGPGFKIINLLVGIPVESFLGIVLLLTHHPAASMYNVADTHTGGGLLWSATEFATVVALVPIFTQWSRADLRAGKRLDARLANGEDIQPPVFEGHGLAATLKAIRR